MNNINGKYKNVQYYFCKGCERKFVPNRALPKMKTPTPFKDWNDVLKSVKTDMVKIKATSPISHAKIPRITKPTPRITPKPVRLKR